MQENKIVRTIVRKHHEATLRGRGPAGAWDRAVTKLRRTQDSVRRTIGEVSGSGSFEFSKLIPGKGYALTGHFIRGNHHYCLYPTKMTLSAGVQDLGTVELLDPSLVYEVRGEVRSLQNGALSVTDVLSPDSYVALVIGRKSPVADLELSLSFSRSLFAHGLDKARVHFSDFRGELLKSWKLVRVAEWVDHVARKIVLTLLVQKPQNKIEVKVRLNPPKGRTYTKGVFVTFWSEGTRVKLASVYLSPEKSVAVCTMPAGQLVEARIALGLRSGGTHEERSGSARVIKRLLVGPKMTIDDPGPPMDLG